MQLSLEPEQGSTATLPSPTPLELLHLPATNPCPRHHCLPAADGSTREVPDTTPVAPSADDSAATCGHGMQDFVGLGISGTEDNALLYSQALRAVDGLCDTCAAATDPSGNYFTLVLPVSWGVMGGLRAPPGLGPAQTAIDSRQWLLAGGCVT